MLSWFICAWLVIALNWLVMPVLGSSDCTIPQLSFSAKLTPFIKSQEVKSISLFQPSRQSHQPKNLELRPRKRANAANATTTTRSWCRRSRRCWAATSRPPPTVSTNPRRLRRSKLTKSFSASSRLRNSSCHLISNSSRCVQLMDMSWRCPNWKSQPRNRLEWSERVEMIEWCLLSEMSSFYKGTSWLSH